MIALFEGVAFDSVRLPLTYNGLTLNDPTDDQDDIYECNVVAIDEQYDASLEPKPTTHGLEAYQARKLVTMIQIDGIIRAPTLAALYDKVAALNAAFDPINAQIADSSSERNVGYLPLTFSRPTADTSTYATGFIASEYYVRSVRRPVARTSQFEGLSCHFSLVLQAADPRAYFQTAQTASRSDAGTIAADNRAASFSSWPTITITLTGSGSQVVKLQRDSPTVSLSVDLTGLVSTDVIVVDMENREITLNGTVDMSLYSSGTFWEMLDKNHTITVSNTSGTLAGTVLVSWGRAFV